LGEVTGSSGSDEFVFWRFGRIIEYPADPLVIFEEIFLKERQNLISEYLPDGLSATGFRI
jgi:hypothetical protein